VLSHFDAALPASVTTGHRVVSAEAQHQAHRLAWQFSGSEPHRELLGLDEVPAAELPGDLHPGAEAGDQEALGAQNE